MFINKKSIGTRKKQVSGRNNKGCISVYNRGGGHIKKYLFVDFFRQPKGFVYFVSGFIYFAYGYLSVLRTQSNNKLFFKLIVLVRGIKKNDVVQDFLHGDSSYTLGCSYFLGSMPVGSFIHNVTKKNSCGGVSSFGRSSGVFCQVIQKRSNVLVKLPSGLYVFFSPNVRCSFGVVGNQNRALVVVGKAGRSRWIGIKSSVRGVAKNPVDHPHGGGEAKSQVGRHPVTPWGRLTKGKKTVQKRDSV